MRVPLFGPRHVLDAARAVTHVVQALGSALTQAQAAMPRIEELVGRGNRLLQRADAAAPRIELLLQAALQARELIDRLDSTLTRQRTEAVGAALDALSTRPDVVPHALDQLDSLSTSTRWKRLAQLVDRLLGDDHDQIDHLSALLDRLEHLLADDRVSRLLDRLDTLLTDDNVERLNALLSAARPDATARVLQRLDETLTDSRAAALQTLLEQLPVLFSAERTANLATLTDQAPRLVNALNSGDLPTSLELRQVPPDLHAMLELIDDLHQVVSGMPGATRARDRGNDPHPQV
jgi:hypothetical protein